MKSIQDTFHDAEGMQYIDYDAGWERFTNRMKDTVEYAEANNQKPGAYFSPFIVLEPWFEKEVPGTGGNYLYRDLLLRDEKGNTAACRRPVLPGRHTSRRTGIYGICDRKADTMGV